MRPDLAQSMLLPLSTALLALLLVACGDADGNAGRQVSVQAEIVEAEAQVSVEATAVRPSDGLLAHGVRVTWNGDQPANLDDARFTHIVEGDDGHLITAGRGCGATWDEENELVEQFCTADLQLIRLAPGEVHEYPVQVYREVGPRTLGPGTYVVEEAIPWWFGEYDRDAPDGELTVRLTYTVE